jgi:hypothetical protein
MVFGNGISQLTTARHEWWPLSCLCRWRSHALTGPHVPHPRLWQRWLQLKRGHGRQHPWLTPDEYQVCCSAFWTSQRQGRHVASLHSLPRMTAAHMYFGRVCALVTRTHQARTAQFTADICRFCVDALPHCACTALGCTKLMSYYTGSASKLVDRVLQGAGPVNKPSSLKCPSHMLSLPHVRCTSCLHGCLPACRCTHPALFRPATSRWHGGLTTPRRC